MPRIRLVPCAANSQNSERRQPAKLSLRMDKPFLQASLGSGWPALFPLDADRQDVDLVHFVFPGMPLLQCGQRRPRTPDLPPSFQFDK